LNSHQINNIISGNIIYLLKKGTQMKKLSIAALSIICCTQQIQSMEEQQITTEKDEYCEILKRAGSGTVTRSGNIIFVMFPSRYGFGENIPETIDLLSLKLYNRNLNETEIEDLIHQGANVNHEDPVFLHAYNSIAMYHVRNDTEQGIKNMAQLIKHGIKLKSNDSHKTPLTVAARLNKTDMIKLLLPLELLSDEETELLSDEEIEFYQSRKEKRKNTVIDRAFYNQNIEIIESLLDLNIITPDEGWEQFVNCMTPNQEILDLLHERKVTCNNDTLTTIMSRAFSSDSSIKFLEQIVTLDNIYDSHVLARLYAIQTMVKNSIDSLEHNKANQENSNQS
jgi:hypothetical protein